MKKKAKPIFPKYSMPKPAKLGERTAYLTEQLELFPETWSWKQDRVPLEYLIDMQGEPKDHIVRLVEKHWRGLPEELVRVEVSLGMKQKPISGQFVRVDMNAENGIAWNYAQKSKEA